MIIKFLFQKIFKINIFKICLKKSQKVTLNHNILGMKI